MADARAQMPARVENKSGVPCITLNQQQESDGTGYSSDDSEDTVRPGSPPHYTYTGTLVSPPCSPPCRPSGRMFRLRSMSGEGAIYMTGASLSTTPLLTGPRRWSTQSAAFSTFERRLSAHRPNVYGTMAASSGQTAIQQTRSVSGEDIEAQSGPDMHRRPMQRVEMIGARLGRLNILRRIREFTTGEVDDSRHESSASSSTSLQESIVKTYQKLEDRSLRTGARVWRSPIGRMIFALGYMILLTLVVGAIAFGVHKLAIISKRDR